MTDDDAHPVDQRGRLAERPFSDQLTRDKILIPWRGRIVKTLARDRIELTGLDDDGVQLLVARMTGNFKRGNEPRR